MPITPFQAQEILNRLARAKRMGQPAADPASTAGVSREIEQLHDPIMKWCNDHRVAYIHADPSGASRINKGAPDFTIVWNGGVLFIECKRHDGKWSTDQLAWRMNAEHQGSTVHEVRTMEHFYALLGSK